MSETVTVTLTRDEADAIYWTMKAIVELGGENKFPRHLGGKEAFLIVLKVVKKMQDALGEDGTWPLPDGFSPGVN